MNKKTVIYTGLVLAVLVCGMMFVGCDIDHSDEGLIRVSTDSSTKTYWARTSYDPDDIGTVRKNFSCTFFDIREEGDYIIYYCEQYEGETISDLDDRIWQETPSVHVIIGETVEVYIPYDIDNSGEGLIRVSTDNSTTKYWVTTSHDLKVIGSVQKNFPRTFVGIRKEGYYTVYYCEQHNDETPDDLDDRLWNDKPPVYVSFGETTEVTIP